MTHPTDETPVFELEDVSKSYGRRANLRVFDQVRFLAPPARFTVIRGNSGRGKTTLLRMLGGIETPESGSLRLLGSPIPNRVGAELDEHCRHIGWVHQSADLFRHLDVLDNVCAIRRLQGYDRASTVAAAQSWIGRLGLSGKEHRAPSQLSGGERQRVAIARALMHGRVILADEPTSALDDANAEGVLRALADAAHRWGRWVVVATHDPRVDRFADASLRCDEEGLHVMRASGFGAVGPGRVSSDPTASRSRNGHVPFPTARMISKYYGRRPGGRKP